MRRPLTWSLVTLLVLGIGAGALLVRGDGERSGDTRPDPPGVSAFRPDDTTLATCRTVRSADRVPCRERALANLAWREDAGTALDELARLAGEDAATQAACHRIAHGIGAAAISRTGSIEEALQEGSDLCISGFGHGVFEHWIAADPDRAQRLLAGDLRLCTDRTTPSAALRHQCLHGAGHGVALLVRGDAAAGIAACERAFGRDARTCVGGLLMEVQYFERIDLDAGERACDQLAERWQDECWHARGAGAIARASVDDWVRAAGACDDAPSEHRGLCASATGEAAAELGAWDGRRIVETCRASVLPDRCAAGAVDLAARFGPADDAVVAACRAFDVDLPACGPEGVPRAR